MAEPSTTTLALATTTTVGAAALFPGVDGNAMIGAFAGATLFVVSARELRLLVRVLYLLISQAMGYIAAPEIVNHTFINETGVAGFIGGLLCITIALLLLEQVKNTTLFKLLRGGRR